MAEIKFNQNIVSLIRKLMKYDIISFDFFDTLVFRCVTNPNDVFLFLSNKYENINFSEIRINSENIAREKKNKKIGTLEVNIFEIYQEFNKFKKINIENAVKIEFEQEKEICYANSYMLAVYKSLLAEGKKIIITSNMYFPEKYIREIAKKCGYNFFDKIYVSCDHLMNKKDGSLFKYIKNQNSDKKIIHIGDTYEVDVEGAIKADIDVHYYERCTNYNKKINICGSSYLMASIYNAISTNYLNNKFNISSYTKKNIYYQHGFKYAGIFIYGYVKFIQKICKDNKVDLILFLSRDGDFLRKVYNLLGGDIINKYVLWSRKASLTTMPELFLNDIFNNIVTRRINQGYKYNSEFYIKKLGLNLEFKKLKNKIITKDNIEEFREFFLDNSKKIIDNSILCKKGAREYFKNIIKSYQNIAIVDIGWKSSGAMSLTNFFRDYLDYTGKIISIVSGNVSQKRNFDSSLTLCGKIISYMFSEYNNRDLCLDFQKNIEYLTPIFEIFGASSESPSFISFGYKNNTYKLNFDIPEVENYKIINSIHEGALDFIKLIDPISNNLNISISGRDVYCFIKNSLNNKHIYNDFKHYTYPRFISDEMNETNISELGNIWGDGKQ